MHTFAVKPAFQLHIVHVEFTIKAIGVNLLARKTLLVKQISFSQFTFNSHSM